MHRQNSFLCFMHQIYSNTFKYESSMHIFVFFSEHSENGASAWALGGTLNSWWIVGWLLQGTQWDLWFGPGFYAWRSLPSRDPTWEWYPNDASAGFFSLVCSLGRVLSISFHLFDPWRIYQINYLKPTLLGASARMVSDWFSSRPAFYSWDLSWHQTDGVPYRLVI